MPMLPLWADTDNPTGSSNVLFQGRLAGANVFSVQATGALTAIGVNSGTGLIQGTGGLTVSGAAVSLNNSSNFNTSINTGTSTGAVTVGNSLAGVINLQSANGTIVSGASGQTADVLQVTNPGNANVLRVNPTGQVIIGPSSLSPVSTSNEEIRVGASFDSRITLGESAAGNSNPAVTLYRTSAGSNAGQAFRITAPGSTVPLEIQSGTSGAATYGTETYVTRLKVGQGGATGDAALGVYGISGQTGNLIEVRNSTPNLLAAIDSAGKLQFADGAGGAVDTNLYRSAANTLMTDDAFTAAGLITGNTGLTVSGGAVNLNASSNFATNINTGTSTGAVAIGNSAASTITLQSGGSNAITLTPGGGTNTGVVVKPTTDSTAAFQIQNAASDTST